MKMIPSVKQIFKVFQEKGVFVISYHLSFIKICGLLLKDY